MSAPVDRSRLDRIHARLELLARCDTQLQVFGASTHEYQLAPPLDEARVIEFERDHGIELPPDYRAFVTTLGNGGAGPFYGLAPLCADPPRFGAATKQQAPSLARRFPLDHAWRQGEQTPEPPIAPGSSVYDGTIELSSHGCGYFDLLVVGGPRRGEVWADFTQALAGLAPWYGSFFDAYEAWLDRAFVEWACASVASLLAEHDVEHVDEALAIAEPLLEQAVAQLDAPPADPALLEYPHDESALLAGLAYLRVRQRRSEDALALFDQLAARSNKDGEARRQLGRARLFAETDQLDQALAAVDAGLGCATLWFATELELLRERRMILWGLDRDDEALDVTRKLAERQSDDLFAQYDLAWALVEREQYDDAASLLIAVAERGVGCEQDGPLAQRIEQAADGLLDALEREDLPDQAAALRERLGL